MHYTKMRVGDVFRVERTHMDGSSPCQHVVTLVEINHTTTDGCPVLVFREDTGNTTEVPWDNLEDLSHWLKLDLLRTVQNRVKNEMDT